MKKYDVICMGLALVNFPIGPVDEMIFKQDVTQVGRMDLLPGGDAANQAIVLSKLGNKVALVTRKGNDHWGTMLQGLLESYGENIDQAHIYTEENNVTGMCAMMLKPDGQRHFCIHRGSLLNISREDFPDELLKETKILSIGGLMSLPKFDGKGSEELLKLAQRNGVKTVADTKKDLWGIGLNGIKNTLAYLDYFFPSKEEAEEISGKNAPEEMAEVFLNAGVKHVGIKLGAQGCYYKDAVQEFYVQPIQTKAVDTTGAGDNFMSGFIQGIVKGWDERTCCEFASAAGAIAVSEIGPNTAVKNYEQVLGLMKGAYK